MSKLYKEFHRLNKLKSNGKHKNKKLFSYRLISKQYPKSNAQNIENTLKYDHHSLPAFATDLSKSCDQNIENDVSVSNTRQNSQFRLNIDYENNIPQNDLENIDQTAKNHDNSSKNDEFSNQFDFIRSENALQTKSSSTILENESNCNIFKNIHIRNGLKHRSNRSQLSLKKRFPLTEICTSQPDLVPSIISEQYQDFSMIEPSGGIFLPQSSTLIRHSHLKSFDTEN